MKLPEIACHDGFIVRDSVQGGTSGTVYCLWKMGDDYNDDIAQGMNYWSSIQIKRVKQNQK